jgi:hypothetical protein
MRFSSLPEILFEGEYTDAGACIEYGVTADGFQFGEAMTRDYPGSGAECDAPSFVKIYADGKEVGDTTWDVFLLDMAVAGMSQDDVYERLLEQTEEWLADNWGDGPEYEKDDY